MRGHNRFSLRNKKYCLSVILNTPSYLELWVGYYCKLHQLLNILISEVIILGVLKFEEFNFIVQCCDKNLWEW